MVSKRAYNVMIAEAIGGNAKISFKENSPLDNPDKTVGTVPVDGIATNNEKEVTYSTAVNGATWELIEKLSKGEVIN